jgi:hypothetical protein
LADGWRRVSTEARIPLTEQWQEHTIEFEIRTTFKVFFIHRSWILHAIFANRRSIESHSRFLSVRVLGGRRRASVAVERTSPVRLEAAE